MGGFVDPFTPSPAWPQDIVFTGSPWTGSATPLADNIEFHLRSGASLALMRRGGAKESAGVDGAVFPGETVPLPAMLPGPLLRQGGGGLGFATAGSLGSILSGGGAPCPISLTDSAPAICSSNETSGSEHSGLPQFLVGDQPLPAPATAWAPAYPNVVSMAGEATSQSYAFGRIHDDDLLHDATTCTPNGSKYQHHPGTMPSAAQLHLHDDAEFNTGELLSFAPAPQVAPTIDTFQINQKEFSGLQHLDLSSLVSGSLAAFNPKQFTEAGGGGGNGVTEQFVNQPDVLHGGGIAAGGGAPKPRVRARRGQATDPHSIAERLRREKISDRMKNLQELVPNSNKTDKASMLDEIIDYVRFLQLQVKVLSMSRLGAAEAMVPLLTESSSQAESNGLLLSPISERQAGAGGGGLVHSELHDSAALEQEVVKLMENNMTTAMQYLQSKGLCLMPVALASVISGQKGTSSAAVLPAGGGGAGGGDKDDVKRVLDALKPLLGSPKEMKPRA